MTEKKQQKLIRLQRKEKKKARPNKLAALNFCFETEAIYGDSKRVMIFH